MLRIKLRIKIKLRRAYSAKRNVCHNYFRDVIFNTAIVLRTVNLKRIIFYLRYTNSWDLIRPVKKSLFGESFSKLKRV